MSFKSFYNKKILVTGHTGFKGSWLSYWLTLLGADVTGFSLGIPTNPSHFTSGISTLIRDERGDIRDFKAISKLVHTLQPDYIFHLAAQPLVSESFQHPIDTWSTNVIGTVNVLSVLKSLQHRCNAIFITSDKCYANSEWYWGYRETDPLGGIDPYSSSKAAAELAISSFYQSYFTSPDSNIRLCSVRAGNVIGGGDWSQARIVPDCFHAWSSNSPVLLRNPSSTRPWQHVLEPLSGYLHLALKLDQQPSLSGQSFNFGPLPHQDHSVLDLVMLLSKYWDGFHYHVDPTTNLQGKESKLLKLSIDKARAALNWMPVLSFDKTIEMTASWYSSYLECPENILEQTTLDINTYSSTASKADISLASQ